MAADETGRFLYVAENDPDAGRGVLHVIDIADRTQPSVTHSIQLAYGAPLKDIEVDAAEQRLYLAATTYVHVFDLTDPAEPQAVGRLYDYMVRNYDEVSVDRVSDPQFGYRSFLTIRARLGGGDGCPTGFAYTYDITGDLFERPLMIANSEIPRMADHGRTDPVDPAFGECPELSLSLNNETFRMEVSWLVEETSGWTPLRRDHFPYNITARFREQADYCILVPV